MASTTSPDGQSEFLRKLSEIRHDPQVKSLAWRHAESPDLAEDALQEAYYAVARMKHPEEIRNLRAYFNRVLINTARQLRSQLGAFPVEDVADVADGRPQALVGQQAAPPVEDTVGRRVLAGTWRERFTSQRALLVRNVPGRSPDPGRYKDVIVSVAERVLQAIVSGDVRDADGYLALSAAYPEWFAIDGRAVANGHQRLSRARADVSRVLRLVVRRTDLLP